MITFAEVLFLLVKNIVVILVLFMFLKPVSLFLEYAVFYDYIKRELCVNKANPEMECNGKCHLKKEIAKASETQNKDSVEKFSFVDYIIFFRKQEVI